MRMNNQWFCARFYCGLNWAGVKDRKMVPPIVPRVRAEDDTRNYVIYNEGAELSTGVASEEDRRRLEDF